MIETMLWTESHRPDTLESVAMSDENRRLLQQFVDRGEIPHLLMLGPPGCGKTTVAKILVGQLDCTLLQLNASNERGIDTIREKIGNFVRGMLGGEWNIVFLDEADQLTRDAQAVLRNMMETYSGRARFILTGNHGYKIVSAIQSRCQLVELARPPLKQRFKVLSRVLQQEGITVENPKVIMSYAERFEDMRRMIQAAQKSVLSNDGTLQPATEVVTSGADVFEAVEKSDWSALKSFAKDPGFDHRQALVDLFYAVPDDHPQVASHRAVIGKAVHESGFTPDPVVHFLGTVAELM